MRIMHWMLAIGLTATLFGDRPAWAQYDPTRVVPNDSPKMAFAPGTPFPYDSRVVGPHPGPMGPGYPMVAQGQPMYAAPGQPMMATGQPGLDYLPSEAIQTHHAVSVDPEGSAGIPPQFQPYPGISPYDHRFEETARDSRGLWFQNINDEADEHFLSIDAFIAHVGHPKDSFIGVGVLDPLVDTTTGDEFEHLDPSVGIEVRLGVRKPDQSGYELRGFYTGEVDDTNRINGLARLLQFRGEYGWHTQAGDIELNRWWTPCVDHGSIELRRTCGLRYMAISEKMDILIQDLIAPFPDFVSTLQSNTRTDLAGPQMGLQLEMGGDTMHLTADAKVALMVNHETLHLEGGNFGNAFAPGFALSNFDQDDSHTHVSPFIEGAVNLEYAAFGSIPVIKKMSLFENAKLRFGYNFIAVGEVVRPSDTVIYRPSPINPVLDVNRTHWVMSAWNVGLEWKR